MPIENKHLQDNTIKGEHQFKAIDEIMNIFHIDSYRNKLNFYDWLFIRFTK